MIFRSDSLFLQVLLILSLNDSKFFPKWPTGIFSVVCIVVPSKLMAATPVGAMSKTFGLSRDTFLYKKILVSDLYITFIKNDLPQPAPPVKKICIGSTTVHGENDLLLT